MYCQKCGAYVKSGSNYCDECGHPQNEESAKVHRLPPMPAEFREPRKNSYGCLIAIIVIVLLVVFGIIGIAILAALYA